MPRAGLTVDTEGYLDHDLAWSNRQCYRTPILVLHNGAAYKWLAVNGLGTDAGVKEPGVSGSENFWKSLAAEALEEVRSVIEEQEFLRKLTIGAPKFHRSTVLPDNHAWPDGSLILFDDWPEFKAVYDAGGFAGMLMPWDADAATQAANLGKFRPNAANPTGLYLPLHGGQFFRAWALGADREAGSWQKDELRSHSHKIMSYNQLVAGNHPHYAGGAAAYLIESEATGGAETRPVNIAQPVITYLGRPK